MTTAKLPNPLDEPELPNPLNTPELPKTQEKLLRRPTFSEKYGWMKPALIAAILVIIIDIAIFYILRTT